MVQPAGGGAGGEAQGLQAGHVALQGRGVRGFRRLALGGGVGGEVGQVGFVRGQGIAGGAALGGEHFQEGLDVAIQGAYRPWKRSFGRVRLISRVGGSGGKAPR